MNHECRKGSKIGIAPVHFDEIEEETRESSASVRSTGKALDEVDPEDQRDCLSNDALIMTPEEQENLKTKRTDPVEFFSRPSSSSIREDKSSLKQLFSLHVHTGGRKSLSSHH